MLAFGFSSGLPYALLIGTLNAWLGEAKINLATIGVDASTGEVPTAAVQRAIAGLHDEESRRKVTRARELGAKSSFHGIAEQLLG